MQGNEDGQGNGDQVDIKRGVKEGIESEGKRREREKIEGEKEEGLRGMKGIERVKRRGSKKCKK